MTHDTKEPTASLCGAAMLGTSGAALLAAGAAPDTFAGPCAPPAPHERQAPSMASVVRTIRALFTAAKLGRTARQCQTRARGCYRRRRMGSTSPYRTRPLPVSRRAVSPIFLPRALLALVVVVVVAPILLNVFLWSRVVTVGCQRYTQRRVFCDVDETSIALSSRSRREATGALRADVEGPVYASRGDVRIVLVFPGGGADLTSGFNGDKVAQLAAAKELTRFLRTPSEQQVTVTFGSRWRATWIFLGLDLLLFLCLYPVFGQRLVAVADRERDTLELRRRVWPLPATRITVPLSRLQRIAVVIPRTGRYQLAAVTDDQQAHPISWSLGVASLGEPAARELNTWVEEERARYRSGVQG